MMASGFAGSKFELDNGPLIVGLEGFDMFGSWGRASREIVSEEDMGAFQDIVD